MCAECHSTGLRKNYDAKTDRFATSWAEISVGCEACHGQGSASRCLGARSAELVAVWQARRFEQGIAGPFRRAPRRGLADRSADRERTRVPPRRPRFARRSRPADCATPAAPGSTKTGCPASGYRKRMWSNRWRAAPIMSMAKSAMWKSRITIRRSSRAGCSPPASPAAIVTSPTARNSGPPAKASACNVMPPKNTPTSAIGTMPGWISRQPASHATCRSVPTWSSTPATITAFVSRGLISPTSLVRRTPATTATATRTHNGPPPRSKTGSALTARVFRPMRRRSMLRARTRPMPPRSCRRGGGSRCASRCARDRAGRTCAPHFPRNINIARSGLSDPDPMVRIGALDMLEDVPAGQVWPFASPLLSDPVRGVRIRAASLLAAVPTASQPPPDRERFERAAAEFIAAQRANADRPEARTTLGSFLMRRGQPNEAETEYKAALQLSPQFVAASINLADLYRQLGRDGEGEPVLRAAIVVSPRDGRGAPRARARLSTRLETTGRSARRISQSDRTRSGKFTLSPMFTLLRCIPADTADEAMAVLKEALKLHPGDREILQALVSFNGMSGDKGAALGYAERLAVDQDPDDQTLARLLKELRQGAKGPAHDRCGSIASLWMRAGDFRFTPNSGRRVAITDATYQQRKQLLTTYIE